MKNIKQFIFGVGFFGSTFVALAWWCSRCQKDHLKQCPFASLFGCDCGSHSCINYGCVYDGYDTEEEEEVLQQIRRRHKQHHMENMHSIMESIRRHVRTLEDISCLRAVLEKKERQISNSCRFHGGYDCGGYDCGDFGCDCGSGYGCDPVVYFGGGYDCGYFGCNY